MYKIYIITLILALNGLSFNCEEIKIKNIKIWGPGLKPDEIIMPARYFFVDANVSYQDIKPKTPFFVINITGKNKYENSCRLWQQILDRKDGSYIVRYKLYETCYNFKIELLYGQHHIGKSPYFFQTAILADDCVCPDGKLSDWLAKFGCKNEYLQMEKDLEPFPAVNFTQLRSKIIDTYNQPLSFSICNYVIQDNKVYRKCYGKYVGFNMFMDAILLSLSRKTKLPNLEFFVNLGDWPLVTKNKGLLPMFSWCGTHDTYDIVMPTHDLTESSLENMGRVMLDILSVQGNERVTEWHEKIPKMFWRGRDSNKRRLDLVDISREYPFLFNVSLTNFFFYPDYVDKYGPKTEHVSFFNFFDYKYQLNLDGTVAAYRFPYLLAGNSVVFKQESKYYEWFYDDLIPGFHYIQVNEDLSNLVEKIQWAIKHDKEVQQISLNAQMYARENLMPQNVFCYYASLLNNWSKRVVSPIEVLEGMDLVSQQEPKHFCDCKFTLRDEL